MTMDHTLITDPALVERRLRNKQDKWGQLAAAAPTTRDLAHVYVDRARAAAAEAERLGESRAWRELAQTLADWATPWEEWAARRARQLAQEAEQ